MNVTVAAEFTVCAGRSRVFFIARDIVWLSDARWEAGSLESASDDGYGGNCAKVAVLITVTVVVLR